MNNRPKKCTKSVHVLFEESLYNELKEYADKNEKTLALVIKAATRKLIDDTLIKPAPVDSSIILNRLNLLEEEVICLRKEIENLEKQLTETNNYVYSR